MKLTYFKENPPRFNWELAFVLSAIFGSGISAFTGNEFGMSGLPEMWVATYGPESWWLYGLLSFIGGTLMAIGARLAGGCTSGHGISGTAQLSLASWISVVCFFIGGIIAVRIIY